MPADKPEYDIQMLIEQAQLSAQKRNFQRAERFYRRVLASQHDNLIAQIGVIDSLRELGFLASAVEELELAKKTHGNNYWIQSQQGRIYLALGDFERAQECYHQLINQDPNEANGYLLLAELFEEQQKYSQQQEMILRVTELFPSHPWALHHLTRFEKNQRLQALKEKIQTIDRALKSGQEGLAVSIFREIAQSYDLGTTHFRALLEIAFKSLTFRSEIIGEITKLIERSAVPTSFYFIQVLIADYNNQRQGKEGLVLLAQHLSVIIEYQGSFHTLSNTIIELVSNSEENQFLPQLLVDLLNNVWRRTEKVRSRFSCLIWTLFALSRLVGAKSNCVDPREVALLISNDCPTFLGTINQLVLFKIIGKRYTLNDIFESLRDVVDQLELLPDNKHITIILLFFKEALSKEAYRSYLKLLREQFYSLTPNELFNLLSTLRDQTLEEQHALDIAMICNSLSLEIPPVMTVEQAFNTLAIINRAPDARSKELERQCLDVLELGQSTQNTRLSEDPLRDSIHKLLMIYLKMRRPEASRIAPETDFLEETTLFKRYRLLQKTQSTAKAKDLRIAVCVSGQLRNIEQVLPTWKIPFLGKDNVDIYLHTWNVMSARLGFVSDYGNFLPWNTALALERIGFRDRGEVARLLYPSLFRFFVSEKSAPSVEKLAELYSTKTERIIVEDLALRPYQRMSNQNKMGYKIRECHELMKRSQIPYDLVVRIRPDFEIKPDVEFDWIEVQQALSQKNAIGFRFNPTYMTSGFYVCDQLAIASPNVMQLYSDYDTTTRELNEEGAFWCKAPLGNAPLGHWKIGWLTWLCGLTPIKIPHLEGDVYCLKNIAPVAIVKQLVMEDIKDRRHHLDTILLAAIEMDEREEVD